MAQCLDKLTPDAFVRSQWLQMWFWSGSQLMTWLLLLESPAGEPRGDARAESQSCLEFGIIHVCFGCVLNLRGGGSGCVGCVQFQLRGLCAIPAAELRCGALQGSTFPKHRS